MLGNVSFFCCRRQTFFKVDFFKNTIKVSNGLDPDQDRHFVRPDLRPNCLQRLFAKLFTKVIRQTVCKGYPQTTKVAAN